MVSVGEIPQHDRHVQAAVIRYLPALQDHLEGRRRQLSNLDSWWVRTDAFQVGNFPTC